MEKQLSRAHLIQVVVKYTSVCLTSWKVQIVVIWKEFATLSVNFE